MFFFRKLIYLLPEFSESVSGAMAMLFVGDITFCLRYPA
jgi:hypothetical protein